MEPRSKYNPRVRKLLNLDKTGTVLPSIISASSFAVMWSHLRKQSKSFQKYLKKEYFFPYEWQGCKQHCWIVTQNKVLNICTRTDGLQILSPFNWFCKVIAFMKGAVFKKILMFAIFIRTIVGFIEFILFNILKQANLLEFWRSWTDVANMWGVGYTDCLIVE